jgi:hypothetical protein
MIPLGFNAQFGRQITFAGKIKRQSLLHLAISSVLLASGKLEHQKLMCNDPINHTAD